MRSIRKIKPSAEDNFGDQLKQISLPRGFDSLFSVIAMVGWIIGGFSLLVGGFGIANIMFVSVKERTSIIGIQKALGAKKLLHFVTIPVRSNLPFYNRWNSWTADHPLP